MWILSNGLHNCLENKHLQIVHFFFHILNQKHCFHSTHNKHINAGILSLLDVALVIGYKSCRRLIR